MARYRGKKQHRLAHPKIFVWSHTKKAEIEYFQDFKNYLSTPLLMPEKEICWTPQELISKVIKWKNKEINEKDNDQVWCIFDVDDFYKNDSGGLLQAIKEARKNNIKIAYANKCFELWILLHFEKPTNAISRADLEKKIKRLFKKEQLGNFTKNQKVFKILLPFQSKAVENAKNSGYRKYEKIIWNKALGETGNPSTSIHFLIEEINKIKSNL
jgi:hypothetical protein